MKNNKTTIIIIFFALVITICSIYANLKTEQIEDPPEPIPVLDSISLNKSTIEIVNGNWSLVLTEIEPEEYKDTKLIWESSDENVCIVSDGMVKSTGVGECIVTAYSPDMTLSQSINVRILAPEDVWYYAPNGTGGYPDIIIEGPFYVDGVLIVNKQYSIPDGFATGVDEEAVKAVRKLESDAKQLGYNLKRKSAYRTHKRQIELYTSYLKKRGQERTDLGSARPGHSEHETGLAFDVGAINQKFAKTEAGIWLKENCYKYGFIIRYPEGKTEITGYGYEPWHIRYVGVELAEKIYLSGKTLEEYFNLV